MDQRQQPESIDFSQIRERVRRNIWKLYAMRLLKTVAVVFLAYIVILGASLVWLAPKLKAAYDNGLIARDSLTQAQHLIVNRDLLGASEQLASANSSLLVVQDAFGKIPLIRWTPFLSSQVRPVDDLLVAGINLTSSGAKLTKIGDDLTKKLRNESIPNAAISKQQKIDILTKIVEAAPILEQVQKELHNANDAMAKVDASTLILRPVAKAVVPLKAYLPLIIRMVDQAVPMVSAAPKLLGFDKPATYLFLIQNNHELRPTGGFIGTYGIVKLDTGDITKLFTDNIYNLDRAFANDPTLKTPQQILNEPSPKPIETWLEQRQWALRDINWDPDFPTTARKAIEMYQKETVVAQDLEKQVNARDPRHAPAESAFPTENIDGLIAITPEIIEGILRITGPITVDGIQFTADNFQDELEFRVGFEYRELGISDSSRKEIIHHLADTLQAKVMALPYQKVLDVLNIGLDSLASKSILLYHNDEALEKMIIDRGWGGEVNTNSLDYLFVVDSNLASLKSDQFVDRFVNYKLVKDGNDYLATVTVTHKHNGVFSWNSSRLRSYTRIYVPQGSKFVSGTGAVFNDKVRDPEHKPGTYDVGEDHGRTVIGGFFVTEPGETTSISFTYKLPKYVVDKINEGAYNLLYQKQPGTNHKLTLDLDFGKTISNSVPANTASGILPKVYKYSESIIADSWYTLKF